jgi:hypothetical protein
MRFMNSGHRLTICLLSWLLLAGGAHAQSEADFFKGKTVRMVVGFASGNEYDIGARLLARYLARHIPAAPTVIVQNMPQAASLVAANYVYTQAPRDGTVIDACARYRDATAGAPAYVCFLLGEWREFTPEELAGVRKMIEHSAADVQKGSSHPKKAKKKKPKPEGRSGEAPKGKAAEGKKHASGRPPARRTGGSKPRSSAGRRAKRR